VLGCVDGTSISILFMLGKAMEEWEDVLVHWTRLSFIESGAVRVTVSSDLSSGEDGSDIKTPDPEHRNLLNKSSVLANNSWLRDRPLKEAILINLHSNNFNMDEGFSVTRSRKLLFVPEGKDEIVSNDRKLFPSETTLLYPGTRKRS
jgi:hypothetical protein